MKWNAASQKNQIQALCQKSLVSNIDLFFPDIFLFWPQLISSKDPDLTFWRRFIHHEPVLLQAALIGIRFSFRTTDVHFLEGPN